MHNTYFITGTDTGIGKTLTSAVLSLALKAHYWKPIESGTDFDIVDQKEIQFLTRLPDQHFISPIYSLKARLSPDQAAALENISIDLTRCTLPSINNSLIVEGAGGVLVPLNQSACMLDLMQQLHLPVIIVARGTLGTINHTLLTIAALRSRSLTIKGIVFSGDLNPDNQKAIEKWGNVRTLLHIPTFTTLTPDIFQTWVQENNHSILETLQ